VNLSSPDTPLYNHPLPEIESWLTSIGGEQDATDLHCWQVSKLNWNAQLSLEVEELTIRYLKATEDQQDVYRSFKYSLSRQDIEDAVLAGP
jgi:Protein of unknown function (DUF3143)